MGGDHSITLSILSALGRKQPRAQVGAQVLFLELCLVAESIALGR